MPVAGVGRRRTRAVPKSVLQVVRRAVVCARAPFSLQSDVRLQALRRGCKSARREEPFTRCKFDAISTSAKLINSTIAAATCRAPLCCRAPPALQPARPPVATPPHHPAPRSPIRRCRRCCTSPSLARASFVPSVPFPRRIHTTVLCVRPHGRRSVGCSAVSHFVPKRKSCRKGWPFAAILSASAPWRRLCGCPRASPRTYCGGTAIHLSSSRCRALRPTLRAGFARQRATFTARRSFASRSRTERAHPTITRPRLAPYTTSHRRRSELSKAAAMKARRQPHRAHAGRLHGVAVVRVVARRARPRLPRPSRLPRLASGLSSFCATMVSRGLARLRRVREVAATTQEVAGVMEENIERLMANGQNLEHLEDKSQWLLAQATAFQRSARAQRRLTWCRYLRVSCCAASCCAILIAIGVLLILPIHGHSASVGRAGTAAAAFRAVGASSFVEVVSAKESDVRVSDERRRASERLESFSNVNSRARSTPTPRTHLFSHTTIIELSQIGQSRLSRHLPKHYKSRATVQRAQTARA